MPTSVNLKNIVTVLHRPSYPENIGAAARAACNMGISQLILRLLHLRLYRCQLFLVTLLLFF